MKTSLRLTKQMIAELKSHMAAVGAQEGLLDFADQVIDAGEEIIIEDDFGNEKFRITNHEELQKWKQDNGLLD